MSENITVTTVENGVKTTREYTPEFIEEQTERLTDKFLARCQHHAKFWAELPDKTPLERTTGVLHSVLAMVDGSSVGMPGMDLVPYRDAEQEEAPSIYDIAMNGREVEFIGQETLTPLTNIRGGNLAFRFVNFGKETADKLAD